MSIIKIVFAAIAFLLPAQVEPTPPVEVTAEDPVVSEEKQPGLWPRPRLMKSLLQRWAQELSGRYKLTEEQGDEVEQAVVDRWSRFLNENREEMEPLINEFIELRMEIEPPDTGEVEDWAQRVGPMFDQMREQFDGGISDMRSILTPMQRIKFEAEAMAFKAGMVRAEQKLSLWQAGEIDTRTEFWEPTREERRRRREESRREEEKSSDEVDDQAEAEVEDYIAEELKAWEQYVIEFIKLHELDGSQRVAALSCLTELMQRAGDHRDRHKEDILELERRINDPNRPAEGSEVIENQLVTLYGPIDEMFTQLCDRIEKIPTTEQRRKAAEKQKRSKPKEVPTITPDSPGSKEAPKDDE